MKKLAVIVLSVFTLAGTALVYPVYHYFLSEVKLQAQLLTHSAISPDQLVTIRIAKKDANRQNGFKRTGEDEIQFRGHMYDVTSASQHGDTLLFQCVSDHNEDMLNTVFTQVLNLNTAQSNLPDNNQRTIVQNCIKEFLVSKPLRAVYMSSASTLSTQYQFSTGPTPFGDVPYSPPKA